jgi:AcrR family transcriptional regulator
MEKRKEYRNAIRSKQLIRNAFLELLNEKSFDRITATDIINRADINRSTFYAHYPDARGLMDEIFNEIVIMFQNMLADIDFSVFFEDPKPILEKVMAFLYEHQALYQKLARSRMALPLIEQLKQVLIQQVLSYPDLPVKDPHSPETMIRVRVLLGGLIDSYRQWLAGDFECTLDEACEEVAKIIKLWAADVIKTE